MLDEIRTFLLDKYYCIASTPESIFTKFFLVGVQIYNTDQINIINDLRPVIGAGHTPTDFSERGSHPNPANILF